MEELGRRKTISMLNGAVIMMIRQMKHHSESGDRSATAFVPWRPNAIVADDWARSGKFL